MENNNQLRQPIVTVCGHVDHGKTSILDCFRGTSIQTGEAGGITQKISFTRYPLSQIVKSCPILKKAEVNLDIPGFLFIDTPGHAAFTNLRKRGGSLADLAIVVVSITEGIKPQTIEVFQILKAFKTPFVIALNKVDLISGWQKRDNLRESIDGQAINVSQQFQEKLLTFQGSLQEHGFDSALYYDIQDFTKQIALVPCSARTKEGIPELLFVLCGLCQRFLKERLKVGENAKGVVLEVKKDKGFSAVETILYDGTLKEGDEIAIAGFDSVSSAKVRAIEEIQPLSSRYVSVKSASAATGLRLHLNEKENLLSGMPFQKLNGDLESVRALLKKELSGAIKLDDSGVIAKADSLGSLEALMTLLRQANINIVKAGIGAVSKSDIIYAQASAEKNLLDGVVVAFNVGLDEEVVSGKIPVFKEDVVYKLIENLTKWRVDKRAEIEREKLMDLVSVCKLEILHQYAFRNSNPAIFGVKVLSGKAKVPMHLMDEDGEEVARIKSLQLDKTSVKEIVEGQESAMALPGINFDRRLGDKKFLYSDLTPRQFKALHLQRDLLTEHERQTLSAILEIKKKKDSSWGS